MCELASITAVGTTAIGAGSSIFSFGEKQAAAAKQNAYNLQKQAIEEKYRTDLMRYNNQMFDRNVSFGFETLDYKNGEMDRQVRMVERAQDGINTNYLNKVGTLLRRQVEEQIAAAFGIDQVENQSRSLRASTQARMDNRGVEGNSLDAVLQEVQRQEGQAITVMEMNRSAVQQQLLLQAQGLKAEADQSLYNLPFNTYSPDSPIAPPSPVGPVSPAAPAAQPSVGSLIAGIGTAAFNGLNYLYRGSGDSKRNSGSSSSYPNTSSSYSYFGSLKL